MLALLAVPGLAQDLKVMSFNIRYGAADDGSDSWPHRKELVAQTIQEYGPDLLGTQECLDFQADYLKQLLSGHGFVGVGRDDGAQGGEMCGIFYSLDKFELLDSGHFWLSPTPGVVASVGWDAALTRMASWVKLRSMGPEPVTFIFANTHFDHVGAEARLNSAHVIRKQLKPIAGTLPVILTGDFNAPADSDPPGPYQVMTGDGLWTDTYRALNPAASGEGTFNGFKGETGGDRIDWILVKGGLIPLASGINRLASEGRYPSDHFPVTATISFK